MIRKIERIFLLAVFLIISFSVSAQEGAYGAYSPYSIYGIGDISKEGSSFTKSMGGVGIATRNRKFINFTNPASLSARDSLSFMADFGIEQNNKVYRQGDIRSANNTFNIHDFVMSFPILSKASAFMVGITPFSDVGYDFSSIETDQDIIGNTGNISYDSYGTGSVYQAFVGAGATFWKRLSVGAELIYYFGNIDKVTNMNYSNDSYRSVNTGHELALRGTTGKFGLQYEQKLGKKMSMVVGATYRLGTDVKGYSTSYRYASQSGVVDTLKHNIDTLGAGKVRIADEIGVGICLKGGEDWMVEFDYLRSNWAKSGFEGREGFAAVGSSVFTSTVSQSFRAGFEFIPNRNDIRYYMKRCSYRAGLYYDRSYYKLDGNNIDSMGLTFGMTFPIVGFTNGLTLGVDLGQRASTRNNMIRERYAKIMVSFNIYDIWFRKNQYR
ncbi:MAG: hypothetical protein IJ394_00130 [Bacteroidales bacterium]|nr:hypothetical protein [Bacteroidales bacterium]